MLPGLTPLSGTLATVTGDARRMHLQHDWVALLGELIQIRLDDRTVRTGRVDGVTPDGAILWIEGHGAESRTMFERCEGFTAWIDYKWDSAGCR
ncbi:hypothetical protein ACX801_04905 [Arthrobacter bambusae]|uniref:hypothetical protein n=1 Tax=unclassified Arthrobacter TaxID=235627 RepID=UPI00254A8CAC|nr:hypothetical protein [Arthrobacter sp. efr-133-R2A-120]